MVETKFLPYTDRSITVGQSVLFFVFQAVMDTEAGPSLMDDNDINTLKKYDMAVERALRELEVEAPGVYKGNV